MLTCHHNEEIHIFKLTKQFCDKTANWMEG